MEKTSGREERERWVQTPSPRWVTVSRFVKQGGLSKSSPMSLSSHTLWHSSFFVCVEKPEGHDETMKRQKRAVGITEDDLNSTGGGCKIHGQQVWNQSILVGKYSSVDIKWSLGEDFRSLLRILSPFPDQRLNDGLK